MARDNSIDSLKGFLIILVIVGHVITSLDNVNMINHAVMGLIYVFHMPLFILISGYVTKRPDQQTARQLWKGVLTIFIPTVIFHALSTTRIYLSDGDVCATLIQFPYGILWYLMCLIYWRVLLYYTPLALLDRPLLHLALALALSLLVGLTGIGNALAIHRALNFYFFFLLGYYYRQGALDQRWWNCNALHIGVAVVLLPLIFWLYPRCGNIMNGADNYTLADLPQKALILSCSVAMSLLVFNYRRDCAGLRHIGKESLFYYLYHFHVIILVIIPLVERFDLMRTLPFIMLYSTIVLGIVFLMTKIPFFKWLVRPTLKLKSH